MGLHGPRLTAPLLARLGLLATALSLAGGAAQAGASACRTVELRAEGTGERILGAEDIAIDPATGTAYIAAYDRRAVEEERGRGAVVTTGGIYALTMAALSDGPAAMVTDLTTELRRIRDFRPHGIDLHRGPDGRTTLFAINRAFTRDDDGVEPDFAIEIFDLTADGLFHRGDRGTLRDNRLCSPNDIAATGPNSFFVTNDHGHCAGFARAIEDIAALERAYVLHYDGAAFSRVAEDLAFANGIAVRPATEKAGARLYVAVTRDNAIQFYDLRVRGTGIEASAATRVDLAAAPDNLSWGPDGVLYVAAHPSLLSYAAYRGGWLGRDTAPSRVLMVDPDGTSVAELYADDGRQLSAATVAAVSGDILLLGSAFDDHLVACRLERAP